MRNVKKCYVIIIIIILPFFYQGDDDVKIEQFSAIADLHASNTIDTNTNIRNIGRYNQIATGTVDLSGGHDWSGGNSESFQLSYDGDSAETIVLDANCANLAAVKTEIDAHDMIDLLMNDISAGNEEYGDGELKDDQGFPQKRPRRFITVFRLKYLNGLEAREINSRV